MRPYSIWDDPKALRPGNANPVILVIALVIASIMALTVAIGVFVFRGQNVTPASDQTQSKNNLKQIGIAFHNYHDVHSTLPPASIVKVPEGSTDVTQGTAQHGWMTSMLPYVDQGALYERVDFHEPWTSAANRKNFQLPVPAYIRPDLEPMTKGLGAAHYSANSQLLSPNGRMRFRDVTDGLSNVLMSGEVSKGIVPWGSTDTTRDPANGVGPGPNQFSGADPEFAQFVLGDGAVRRISAQVDPKIMRQLSDPADGEAIGSF